MVADGKQHLRDLSEPMYKVLRSAVLEQAGRALDLARFN
jgi:hypothetical protein